MDGDTLAAAIRGAQRGDAAAYDQIIKLFAGRVYGFLYRSTASRQEAEDLLQEVFLRIVRMIPQYAHDGRFEAWIFRIAANLIRDRIRRSRRAPKTLDGGAKASEGQDDPGATEILDDVPGEAKSPDGGLVLAEELSALTAALARLPDAEREVILLRHFSQMSFREIAEMMGTPVGTALARAHRGLARLRTLVNGSGAAATHRTESVEC